MKQILLSAISLDLKSKDPLHRQLFLQLREAILDGTLKAGTRLPSTRLLAKDLNVSRNTILAAFDQLMAEGYLTSRTGSGTFISDQIPDEILTKSAKKENPQKIDRHFPLSSHAAALHQKKASQVYHGGPFSPGTPELEQFPFVDWSRLLAKHWRRPKRELLTGNPIGGSRDLREALSDYLAQTRAVKSDPEQIIVLSGSQQAIHLVVRAFANPGDPILMEDPGFPGVRNTIIGAGATPIPVPVDDEGFSLEAAEKLAPEARLACIAPSHQYPLGPTMSLPRRLDLLNWAKQTDSFLLEDDYDSEYRYTGRPLSSLQGLDTDQRVIYVGSMSKVMFSGLRIGYMVVPPDLVDMFLSLRRDMDGHSPATVEPALAEFIREGHLSSHIRRMRLLYDERQQCLLKLLQDKCGDFLDVKPQESGMHLVAFLKDNIRDLDVEAKCKEDGLLLRALSRFYHGPKSRNGLIIGFAGTSKEHMPAHVDKLQQHLVTLNGGKT
ncbi:aminotransferase class I/II-fold pyridoxal phosphate-dependent enzyme [Sneathiella sp. P13V-1]|uniref:MocR-like pyridoxine biosynthesis transcription factor PdxR n=1 Tax=Sneathiella sp. P13V-1 TaxID=2697366 RepID=UPI00187BB7D7|nr:PLP-dependent aminotransferase family protein [Sneathiella sp. P13V-1]MBE7635702.1 aminotransferase class I/II-fold pyridoxal phosphate-dependent enzyme [Sneathiella sp. P13V-1]